MRCIVSKKICFVIQKYKYHTTQIATQRIMALDEYIAHSNKEPKTI